MSMVLNGLVDSLFTIRKSMGLKGLIMPRVGPGRGRIGLIQYLARCLNHTLLSLGLVVCVFRFCILYSLFVL